MNTVAAMTVVADVAVGATMAVGAPYPRNVPKDDLMIIIKPGTNPRVEHLKGASLG
jgi:hypothetical protein